MYRIPAICTRLLCWLAYRVQDRLLENAWAANVALILELNTARREIAALRRAAAQRDWLDRVDSERRAVRILGATQPGRVPPLNNMAPYQAPPPRPWELS